MKYAVAIAISAALLYASSAADAHALPNRTASHVPPVIRVAPTIVRAQVVPDRFPTSLDSSGTQYMGKVTTIPGIFQNLGPVTADPDTGDLIVTIAFSTYPNPSRTVIEFVSPNGHATELTSINGGFGGMVYDPGSKLIYASEGCTIVTVSPKTRLVASLAGSSTCGTADGTGASAQFQGTRGIALDPATQTLYVADKDRIRSVTEAGVVKTITAPGSIGPPNEICFFGRYYQGLTFDPDNGLLYLADACVQLIRQIDPARGKVTTLAGQCVPDQNGNNCLDFYQDGHGSKALFGAPAEITYDHQDGFLYVSDYNNEFIRRVSTTGDVTTLAGDGHAEFRDGIGQFAGFDAPFGIAVASSGAIQVADVANNAIRSVVADGPPPPPPPHGISLYNTPSIGEAPFDIAAAPDGSMWYSVPSLNTLGKISTSGKFTEISLGSGVSPAKLAIDVSGDIWFTNNVFIGEYTASGNLMSFPIPSGDSASDITIGPDGDPWFVANQSIGTITPSGSVVQYAIDVATSITRDYSSDLWTLGSFSNYYGFIDDISLQGTVLQRFQYNNFANGPIAHGPNGKVWVGQPQAIGEIFPHNILLFQLPPSSYASGAWGPLGLVEGPDKALWFTANLPGYIGRMTAGGKFTPYEIPAPRSAPTGIAVSTGGTIWFTDPGAGKIGRWF